MGVSAAWVGAAISAVAADDSSRRAGHAKDDAAAAKLAAESTAATNANARIQMQRKAMQDNALVTGGGAASAPGAGGRATLGV